MPTLRPALLVATILLAAIAAAWVWLWLDLTHNFGNQATLREPTTIAYLACGPGAALLAALACWWRARVAGWLLTVGGLGASVAVWLGRVPDYGAPEGLWCLGLAMVALGAGWLAVAAARRAAVSAPAT